MIKKLIATVSVLAGLFNPAIAGNTIEDHRNIIRSLERVGVQVQINPPHCELGFDGVYNSYYQTVNICQDHKDSDYVMVPWTDNDLDTLRHEAHHVVQDCLAEKRGDDKLTTLFEGKEYVSFVINGLPSEVIERIEEEYKKNGASSHVIEVEREAFAVAFNVEASSIAKAIINVCE